MRTYTQLKNLFVNLSQNSSTANFALAGQLINDQHRYLIQKYFDNERSVTLLTVGAMKLTLTAPPTAGATSATLTTTWNYVTCTQLVTFSDGEQLNVLFTTGSTAISWQTGLQNNVTTAISTVGVQNYNIPANASKIKNNTINVGQLKYQPVPVQTRAEWDMINFLPYTSDIPNYYFIYNGTLEIFPIPSTTGNVITFNYQTRVADLSYEDYAVGTLATETPGSTFVTGTSTSWTVFPQNINLGFQNLNLLANPSTGGDGIWYPISTFTSATALTLALPIINAPNVTTATTYTIGQLPLLSEDFHDMLVYGALKIYFNSIVPDPNKFKEFDALYQERLQLLESYAGTKYVNVDLGDEPQNVNPNLFLYANN